MAFEFAQVVAELVKAVGFFGGSVADRRKIHAASMLLPYTERVCAEAFGNIELILYDLLDQLHPGHGAPGVEETLEAEHWINAAFYPPMILFDNIVQVGQVRIWTGLSQR